MTPLRTLAHIYRYKLEYEAYAIVSRALVAGYFLAPRELIQDEIALWQRRAVMKAHTARMRSQELTEEYTSKWGAFHS